jgi:hypothetical protein
VPSGIFEDAGQREIKRVSPIIEENMVALKRDLDHKEISGRPKEPRQSTKIKFGVFGKELIEKEVKKSGNSGRVYLPWDWVGKHVKIIRID